MDVSQDMYNLDSETDIVIFSTGHKEYSRNDKLITHLNNQEKLFIYDTIGILNQNEISFLSQKHTVKVLGRGDI